MNLAPFMVLAVDTSTRASVVVLGSDAPVAVSRREVQHRHGSHVLEQIDEVLGAADLTLADIDGLAVGTGPGSFTGLRVGMATVKTIAYARELPLLGVPSSTALRDAAERAGAGRDAIVVLPAGARDHYLSAPGVDPQLVAPHALAEAVEDHPVITLDMESDLLGDEAAGAGAAALDGLPSSLLSLAQTRFAAGDVDDIAELIPAYVALPRGVKRGAEDLGWSPDLR